MQFAMFEITDTQQNVQAYGILILKFPTTARISIITLLFYGSLVCSIIRYGVHATFATGRRIII